NGDCGNNNIFNNSFIDNGVDNAQDYGTNNQWDYGTIGNYWSDYEDIYVPPATNDGLIWNTSYQISGSSSSQDNYPCVYPFYYSEYAITFEISDEYLNTTIPFVEDNGLEINCSIVFVYTINWAYLCENSSGIFINRSMNFGVDGEWTYILDISGLSKGSEIIFSFYVNNSIGKISSNDNNGQNFSIIIGEFYPPSSNIVYQIQDTPNFVSNLTLFSINAVDEGNRPSGVHNISYK
ncbi:unnamed protein product, partial [marine sediment metagenome]